MKKTATRRQRLTAKLPEIEYALNLIVKRLTEIWQSLPQHSSVLIIGLTTQQPSRNAFHSALVRWKIPGIIVQNGRIGRFDHIGIENGEELRPIFTFENEPGSLILQHEEELRILLTHFCVLIDARNYILEEPGKHSVRILPSRVIEGNVIASVAEITRGYSIVHKGLANG